MTAYYIDESVLEHRGVKGMKWGVRRSNPSGGADRVKTTGLKARNVRAKEQYIERVMSSRDKIRGAVNSGSALKGFAKAGVLGVAAVKSPKFREKMNKVWDNADAMDRQKLSNIRSGKKTFDNLAIQMNVSVLDLVMVNRRDRNR